jgi:hypothetical protein
MAGTLIQRLLTFSSAFHVVSEELSSNTFDPSPSLPIEYVNELIIRVSRIKRICLCASLLQIHLRFKARILSLGIIVSDGVALVYERHGKLVEVPGVFGWESGAVELRDNH